MKKYEMKQHKQKSNQIKRLTPILAIIIAIVSFFVLKPLMTGFIVVSEEVSYIDKIDEIFDTNQQYVWEPEHKGEFTSVRVSGSIIGEGSVKLYLKKNDIMYLLLDGDEVRDTKTAYITGLVIGVNETINESLIELNEVINDSLIVNYSVENQTLPPSSPNATEEVEAGEPLVVSPEKVIEINLAYNSGTDYDVNDDGIETKDGIIDFSVKDSSFSWDVDFSNVCTKWEIYAKENKESTIVCYGAKKCCNFIELQPGSENWNDALYLYSGRYGATANNIVSAQVIYVDYSLDAEELSAEIYSIFSFGVGGISLRIIFSKDILLPKIISPGISAFFRKLSRIRSSCGSFVIKIS